MAQKYYKTYLLPPFAPSFSNDIAKLSDDLFTIEKVLSEGKETKTENETVFECQGCDEEFTTTLDSYVGYCPDCY